ncbi:hypothetical protein C1Y63_11875 [Corynebacterium sp. 13CS0277]|nr:hypothetical protein C1Y63_11875 [Corynebacterium sp. 13CS0277]
MVGTVQLPIAGDGVGATADLGLWPQATGPGVVPLRGNRASFNQRYEFAIVDGNLVARAREDADGLGWRAVPLPACLAGRLQWLSADDDEVALVAQDGWIFTLDRVSSTPLEWNVSSLWGAPFWLAGGRALPATWEGGWSYGVNNRLFDHHYLDAAGKQHTIGAGRMTMIAALQDDGSVIRMLDPWLPNDDSYQIPAPLGGRFRATQLSGSASTFFLANDTGEMYVRSWDFDRAGSDIAFFRYHWDERDLPTAENKFVETFNPNYAANHLPVPDWSRLPAIPGTIARGISVSTPAPRVRLFRVAGVDAAGRRGVWELRADVADVELGRMDGYRWGFVPQPLGEVEILDNRAAADPGYQAPLSEVRGPQLRAFVAGEELVIPHYDLRSDRLPVMFRGQPATLHIVDGLRIAPSPEGLSEWPRHMHGAIETERPGPSVAGKEIIPVTFLVTRDQLLMYPL